MNNKLQIFKEHLLPVFKEKFGESVFFDEQNSLVKFYENGKFVLQFYPIGNVLMMPGGVWIKERAVDYLFDKMLDGPNPELRALLYPFQDPQIKKAKLTKKRKKIESISETLTVVGGGFSEENLSKKHTLAFAKMADLLECCGIPHIKEFPVVVKRSAENKGLPKLYLLDFYIPPPFSFIIEVDGGYHSTPEQIEYDRIRDISIKAKGIGKTIRFSNEVILNRRFELLPSLMKEKIFQESLSRYRTQLSRREF